MEVDIKVKKLAIYIHIPFCRQKCKYCDFNSFYTSNENRIRQYIDSLLNEIEFYAKKSSEFVVTSVYFGGGTPSFIDEKYIEEIIIKVKLLYKIAEDVEFTIEANPGTINFNKLKKYKELGVNRLSFGAQTTNDVLLKNIGRIHTAHEIEDGFLLAREAGFNNVSLDIMFGLPNQTIDDVRKTLSDFIKLNPEHISAYSLKIEENTEFGKLYKQGKLILPTEEDEREMCYIIKSELEKAGYNQYEISNFSKVGYESRHNTAYWERQDYLGFGISAASCFNEIRFTNTANFAEYINNPIENFSDKEELTDDVIKSERIILGLRLLKGINENAFEKAEWKNSMEELIKKGLLKKSNGIVSLTGRGLDLANQVFVEFI